MEKIVRSIYEDINNDSYYIVILSRFEASGIN